MKLRVGDTCPKRGHLIETQDDLYVYHSRVYCRRCTREDAAERRQRAKAEGRSISGSTRRRRCSKCRVRRDPRTFSVGSMVCRRCERAGQPRRSPEEKAESRRRYRATQSLRSSADSRALTELRHRHPDEYVELVNHYRRELGIPDIYTVPRGIKPRDTR